MNPRNWIFLQPRVDLRKVADRPSDPHQNLAGMQAGHMLPWAVRDLATETGGLMFFVQYVGPSTGKGPIYDGRFNVEERKPLSQENLRV